MSIRTIIEINHDMLDQCGDMTIKDVMLLIERRARATSAADNTIYAETRMHGLGLGNGLKRLSSHHHQCNVKIQLNGYYAYSSKPERSEK